MQFRQPKQLDTVAFVARTDENQAAGELRQQQQSLRDAQNRVNQLQQFRGEYAERLQGMASSGIDARQLADYRRFLAGLDDAIRQQGEHVQHGQGQVLEAREQLRDRSLRRGSLDELIDRTRASLARDAGKREQQQNDEMSLQRHSIEP